MFILGLAIGFVAGREYAGEMDEDMRWRVGYLIVFAWFISTVATIVVPDYQTSIWLHAMMGTVAGYLFGFENPIR